MALLSDQQNAKVKSLSEEILKHEKIVEELKKLLTQQGDELSKINPQKSQPGNNYTAYKVRSNFYWFPLGMGIW